MLNKFRLDFKDAAILIFIFAMAGVRVLLSTYGTDNAFMNFTPIAAIALFGGAYFSNAKAFIMPMGALWISDIILNKTVFYGEWVFFYDGVLWVYAAFALMVLVGRLLKPQKNAGRFLGSSLAIVFIHWIVTDIGVWLSGTLYPMTLEGYWMALVAAIPFELNLFASTLFFGAIMFGAFEWWKERSPKLNAAFQEA